MALAGYKDRYFDAFKGSFPLQQVGWPGRLHLFPDANFFILPRGIFPWASSIDK
jgi:hypothetical protein